MRRERNSPLLVTDRIGAANLSLADRQAIVEILRETKKDLPRSFQADLQ